MGVVETIPGVSGSTIALVGGIYERFIKSLKSFNLKFFNLIFKFKLKEAFLYIDGKFLISVLFGMILGIVLSIFTITKFLETNPHRVWAFFFGLVLASGIILLYKNFIQDFFVKKEDEDNNIENIEKEKKNKEKKRNELYISNSDLFSDKNNKIEKKENIIIKNNDLFDIIKNIFFFIIGLFGTLLLVFSEPAYANETLLFVFLAGILAISAFLLPGISGSFVLLLLGVYSFILNNLKSFIVKTDLESFLIIVVFSLGILFGVIFFSRFIHFIFKKWKKNLIMFLSGVIFGSLFKLWPWKNPEKIVLENGKIINLYSDNFNLENYIGSYKVILENNFIPAYSFDIYVVFLFFVLGFLSILLFNVLSEKKDYK